MFLDVYKDGEVVESIGLSASKRLYTVGRQEGVVDIRLVHASISREQATLTVSASGSVVVTDLGSAQGTYISGKRIEPKKQYILPAGRSLVFGKSTRVFKLREGDDGFVTSGPDKARAALNEPLTEALLRLLRVEAGPPLRLMRPDGFALAADVAASPAITPFMVSAGALVELALSSTRRTVLEHRSEGGSELLRARSGHAPRSRVDASLVLRPLSFAALPAGNPLYSIVELYSRRVGRFITLHQLHCITPFHSQASHSHPPSRRAPIPRGGY